MDKLLPKLNCEEIQNLNLLINWISNQKPPDKKNSLGSNGFPGEFYQTSEELTSVFLKLCPKIKEEGTIPNSSYEASITLILKSKARTL